jgi:hypothetical protein
MHQICQGVFTPTFMSSDYLKLSGDWFDACTQKFPALISTGMKDAESHQVIDEWYEQELDMKIYALLLCGLMATTSFYAEYSGESH